ncbi:hypothetical protein A0257_03285 [Hymenobacter psoromatis]|nr:hypothetical protein A0257_03285 [Hymenobacter psoromatis]
MLTKQPHAPITARAWRQRAALLAAGLSLGPAAFSQAPAFAPVVNYDAGTNSAPSSIVVADVNGDGKPDFLTANYYSSTVCVQLGTGTGSFSSMAVYSTGAGSFPCSVAVADVNGDGKPDVLTANSETNTVAVLLGTGTGSFGNRITYSTGANSSPNSIVAADVNGDGQPDLLTANLYSSTVGVLLSTGAGSFGAVTTYSTGALSYPLSIAVADVNGDGQLDLLTANTLLNAVGVLLGTGTGSFGAVAAYDAGPNSGPFSIVVADVNGDGRPDLLTANHASDTVGVLLGTGTGSFGAVTTYSTGANTQPYSIAVADVNGDGKLDVLMASGGNPTAGVLLGTGTGSFGAALAYSAGPASYPHGIAVADVNGDGKPDIFTANSGSNTVGVLLSATMLATRAALPGTSASLYPNPARTRATLSAAGLPLNTHLLEATLYNALGQPVRHLALLLPAAQRGPRCPQTACPPGYIYCASVPSMPRAQH